MRKTTVAALAALCFASMTGISSAKVEHIGTPPEKLPVLGQYGMEVSAKSGLKSIVPKGWAIYAHKQLILPDTLSWKADETWLEALSRVADTHKYDARIDWGNQAVYLKPLEAAVVEEPPKPPLLTKEYGVSPGDVREIVTSAMSKHGYLVEWNAPALQLNRAITLLGNHPAEDLALIADALDNNDKAVTIRIIPETRTVRVFGDVPAAVAPAVIASATAAPASTVPATPAPSVVATPVPASKGTPAASPSPAQPKETPALPAPKAAEPPALASAPVPTGTSNPATVKVDPSPSKIEKALVKTDSAGTRTEPVAIGAYSPVPYVRAAAESGLVLSVSRGQQLEDRLGAFLADNGWTLKWRVNKRLEAESSATVRGNDVKAVLSKLMPSLGLTADMYWDDRIVLVQPLDTLTD